MAKAKAKSYAEDWEHNHEKYPIKKGDCSFCGTRGDIKMSFDCINWICIDARVCLNRWKRQHSGETD